MSQYQAFVVTINSELKCRFGNFIVLATDQEEATKDADMIMSDAGFTQGINYPVVPLTEDNSAEFANKHGCVTSGDLPYNQDLIVFEIESDGGHNNRVGVDRDKLLELLKTGTDEEIGEFILNSDYVDEDDSDLYYWDGDRSGCIAEIRQYFEEEEEEEEEDETV